MKALVSPTPNSNHPHTPLHVGLQVWDGHWGARYKRNLPSLSDGDFSETPQGVGTPGLHGLPLGDTAANSGLISLMVTEAAVCIVWRVNALFG